MNQDSSKYFIAQLIYKSITGIITDDEKELLDNWLAAKNNRAFYKKIISKKSIDSKLSIYQQTSAQKIYDRLEKKILIDEKKAVVPLYKKPWFKYALAASVLLLFTLTIVVNNDNPAVVIQPTIVNNDIKIGTDKAVLTLDDGSEIALEKGQSYQMSGISSNGEQVVYNSSDAAESKIKYNILTIPRGGQFSVALADGTHIWLNSESKLKYPTTFIEGKMREVELVYGEAYFDVSPSTSNNGSKFKVFTGKQSIEVLGTEFNVKGYKDEDEIYTTLVEGKIAIEGGNVKKILRPGQQATYTSKNQNLMLKSVDIYNEVSWKDGVFSFKDMPLKKIMNVLSRWYNVEVVFTDAKKENVEFTGVIGKNQELGKILSIINQTNNINYKIKNNTITIQ